jgi:hypothetical protein
MKKKKLGVKFPSAFLSPMKKTKEKMIQSPKGKGVLENLTLDFFFRAFNFLFIITNQECKTI